LLSFAAGLRNENQEFPAKLPESSRLAGNSCLTSAMENVPQALFILIFALVTGCTNPTAATE
jgi:hypothetical protein